MWRKGGAKRFESLDGRSLDVIVLCANRGFRGRVLSLASVFGPVSGAGLDNERRVMFDSLSVILGSLLLGSVWIVGGDVNAEIGFQGVGPVGEESMLGPHAHGRRTRSGHQLEEWALVFSCVFTRQSFKDACSTPKVGVDIQSIIFFVGLGIIDFWGRL